MSVKTCSKCGEEKPLTEFYLRGASLDGYRGTCKPCTAQFSAAWRSRNLDRVRTSQKAWNDANRERKRHWRRRYYLGIDLSPEEIDAIAVRQGHRCAICDSHESELTQGLHLDHDHATGVVRGFLCRKCNTGLGLLGDTASSLRRALDYLEASAQWTE